MKKAIVVLLASVLSLASALAWSSSTTWFTEGQKTNPSDNTVLADTGDLTPQVWNVTLVVSGTVLTKIKLQRRNVDNNGTLQTHEFSVNGNEPFSTPILKIDVLDEGESIRVVTEGTTLGQVQVSIFLG